MKVSKSTPKHKIWLAYAEDDLQNAKTILHSPHLSVIGVLFHSQQCAEKALKSFLVYHHATFRKTHDLVELVNACADIHFEFLGIKELAHELNPYATEIRYPESFYLDLYEAIAEDAVIYAEQILAFTKSAIEKIARARTPEKTDFIEL